MPTYLEAYRAARAASASQQLADTAAPVGTAANGGKKDDKIAAAEISSRAKRKEEEVKNGESSKKEGSSSKDKDTPKASPEKSTPKKAKAVRTPVKKTPTKPIIDIGKQKGLYDTKAVRTQVHKWQALAAAASFEDSGNSSADDRDLDNAAPGPVKNAESTHIPKDIKVSTAPRKRVVSDEHWKKDRAVSGTRDTPKIVKSTALGFHTTLYIPADGKTPEGFVRKKTAPPKITSPRGSPNDVTVKKHRDASAPAKLERGLGFKTDVRRPSGRERSSDVDIRLKTVMERDEDLDRPKSEPDRPSKTISPGRFRDTYTRKTHKTPDARYRSEDEDEIIPPVVNPHVSRMHAWLAGMPDPFVEELEDANTPPQRPHSVSDLGSMLGPRTTRVRDRDGQERRRTKAYHNEGNASHSDDESHNGSVTSSLKRSGARRKAHSPKVPGGWAFDEPSASNAIQLAPVPGELVSQRNSTSRPGANRDVASHADLLSVLSMPGDEGKKLLPAKSVRTKRGRLGRSTLDELFIEIRGDEAKYSRDLRTLVDGVIPVLLNGAISGMNEALGGAVTKDSIVTLGIALERLQSAHSNIPMRDLRAFLHWTERTHQVYADYIRAWGMHFKGMMVNLAPGEQELAGADTGAHGDGERVEVTFLLKRPLVRLKYLAKTIKGVDLLEPSNDSATWAAKYQGLVEDAKVKQDTERARLEDEAAAAVDNTRVRNPESLAPISGPTVRTDRCVRARDLFDLHLNHSSGQKIDCRVMLFLRDDSAGEVSGGDVLICQIEDSNKWLLFPPAELNRLSARRGDSEDEIVVLMRSHSSVLAEEWRELLTLTADSRDVATDWLKMLSSNPMPPLSIPSRTLNEPAPIVRRINPRVAEWVHEVDEVGDPNKADSDIDIPIGEQSVLSTMSRDHRPRSNARQVQFEDYIPPANLGYAEKAKANLKNLFSDLATSRMSPPGGVDRSRPSNLRRTPPSRPPIRRQLSPIPSESVSILSKARSADQNPTRDDYSEPTTPADPVPILEPTTPPAPSLASRSRYHGKTRSAEPAPDPHAVPQQAPSELRNVSTPQLSPVTPLLGPVTPASNARRRSSSPLKHEYVPQESQSDTSPPRSDAGFDDAGSVTSESSVDDLVPELYPEFKASKGGVAKTRQTSTYSAKGTAAVAPSQSVSQIHHDPNAAREPSVVNKTIASIFTWSDKGAWAPLHADLCSVIVSPGLIEAFRMTAAHARPVFGEAALHELREIELPLVALELTPLVPLRQGTAIDISIRSPPTANSQIRTGSNILFRSRTGGECDALYQLINQARINNPRYLALQNARGPVGGSGWGSYMDRQASGRSSTGWWKVGSRKGSYRASSKRNTASVAETYTSAASMSSAISALKRFSNGSKMFNVARSTITSRVGGNSQSRTTSTTFTGSSGSSTPVMLDSSKGSPAGMTDLKIRLYERETLSKWRDIGAARLTIMHPPRPTAEVITPTGHLKQEKRIVVTGESRGETMLDVTLGETSFERVARTGIAVKIWEQHQEVGKTGGVLTAVVRVFMIQMKSEAEAAYAFSLVGRQRY